MTNKLSLLVKYPHTETYVESLLDSAVFQYLIEEGWHFSINFAGQNRPYVKLHRTINGVRQHRWLHRHITVGDNPDLGHSIEIHHVNFNSLDNTADNLRPLPQLQHRRLHHQRRRELKEVANA